MENVEGGRDSNNIDLNDAPTSNGDDEHLVDGQTQCDGK